MSDKNEDEMSAPQKPRKLGGPSLAESREAHQRESDRVSKAILEGTVDHQQPGPGIFDTGLTPQELRERQRQRLEAMVALKGAFRIFEAWKLSDEQMKTLLGTSDDKTFSDFKCASVWSLPNDTLMRISYILGIYKALRILFPTEQQAAAWPHKPNRAFEGRSALELMLNGDLPRVRRYLDGQCPDDSDSISQRNCRA